MSYADYNFYVTEFHGDVIPDEAFDKYAQRASDYLDYITMGKAKSYDDTTDALAKACCAVAEQIDLADSVGVAAGMVASETVGSHSVSYRSGAEMKASLDASMLNAAQMYLLSTGLLYRGVPCIRRIP